MKTKNITHCGASLNAPEKTLKVSRLHPAPPINADWHKPEWAAISPIKIEKYMGRKPAHQPETHARIGYDDDNIYVIFHVKDRFVRAVADRCQGPVWEDSCCEFFFSPGPDIKAGYFNLEMNCGGTLLLHFSKAAKKDVTEVAATDCMQIEVAATLPARVDPEITEPTDWSIEYRLPIAILEKYTKVDRPAPGVTWKANFYKCGDKTSQPHWLTWSVIDKPEPNFHVPESFGTLEFI